MKLCARDLVKQILTFGQKDHPARTPLPLSDGQSRIQWQVYPPGFFCR